MGDAERAVRSGWRRRRAATVAAPLAVLAVVGGVWFVSAISLGGGESLVADAPPSEVTAADLQAAPNGVFLAMPGGYPSSTLEFGDGTLSVDYGCNTSKWRRDGQLTQPSRSV